MASRQTITLVQALREDAAAASRNRNFARYDCADGRAALRLHRLLLSLERDLADCELRAVVADDAGVRITVHHRALALTRTVHLDEDELALLDATPALASRLHRALHS